MRVPALVLTLVYGVAMSAALCSTLDAPTGIGVAVAATLGFGWGLSQLTDTP